MLLDFYSDLSVSSITVIVKKKEDLSFCFNCPSRNFDGFIFVMGGSGLFENEDLSEVLTKNSLVLLQKGDKYSVRALDDDFEYIATGYTDLRRGIDGLASTIKYQFELDPFQKNILFLFCGKRTDRIKGLVWEGDGFLLLYKRLNVGGFSWPRTKEEALEVTPEQYRMLMQGLEIVAKRPIEELTDPPKTM